MLYFSHYLCKEDHMKPLKIIYSFLAVTFLTATLFFLSYLFHSMHKTDKEALFFANKLEQSNMQLQMLNNSYSLISQNVYDNIINKDEIISIVKQANFADSQEELGFLRKKLYQELSPLYTNLNAQSIRQLHFHLQGNISFLRFHRPEKFGDSLVGVRYSIDRVNRIKTKIHGFEEGRVFNGFRNVYPILSNKRLIGTVEISYSFNAIREQAQRVYPAFYDFILKKDIINTKVWEEEKENYLPSNLSDKYLIDINAMSKAGYEHLDEELIEKINKNIAQEVSHKVEQEDAFILQSKVDGQSFLVTFIPIINIANKHAAYFISYQKDDITAFINSEYLYVLEVSFLVSFLVAFLLVMYYTARKRSENILEDMATTDPLTKIANRNKLNLVMDTSIQTALRYNLPLSIIFFDIDHFKEINDKLGHETGDDILIELTALVNKHIRLSDLFARWGGEEFIIVLPETDHNQAVILAEKLRKTIDDHTFGISVHTTCSFGVTQLHEDDDEHTFLKRADVALYSAKERGRNRVVDIE